MIYVGVFEIRDVIGEAQSFEIFTLECYFMRCWQDYCIIGEAKSKKIGKKYL